MFIIISMKENTDETKKMSAEVENHYHAPVTNNNYNGPVTNNNYNCVGCTLNFGGDMDRAFMSDHLPIRIEMAEECEECEAEPAEDVDEEEKEDFEAMFPQLFREELNLDALIKEVMDIAYMPDYPMPYLNGIGRWYVFYKFFTEYNMIEKKHGKQKMFQEFIERVFGWEQETRDFSSVVPSAYLRYSIDEWPSEDRYAVMADYIRECFIERGIRGRRQLKSKFLKEGRYIDISMKRRYK